MDAKELRIGNWVLDDTGISFEVNAHGILNYYLTEKKQWYLTENKQWSGIPLTEEWLLKFGFKHDYEEYYEIENQEHEFRIAKTIDGFILAIGSEYHVGQKFEHVHQLQNLCFALTGEELTIK
jgi:hypothetical protein